MYLLYAICSVQRLSFWVLEIPSPELRMFWVFFATHSQLGSFQPPIVGIPLPLHKCRCVLFLYSLMALGYTIHWCPLEPCFPVGLMCQAIDPYCSKNPVVIFLHLVGGRAPLFLVIIFISHFWKWKSEVPLLRSKVRLTLLFCLGNCQPETGTLIFLE